MLCGDLAQLYFHGDGGDGGGEVVRHGRYPDRLCVHFVLLLADGDDSDDPAVPAPTDSPAAPFLALASLFNSTIAHLLRSTNN